MKLEIKYKSFIHSINALFNLFGPEGKKHHQHFIAFLTV